MDKRLEHAIEKVIYWSKAYSDSRKKFNETNDDKYDVACSSNYIHLLASSSWLGRVYEEETGKKITKIGNLPEVGGLNESTEKLFKGL